MTGYDDWDMLVGGGGGRPGPAPGAEPSQVLSEQVRLTAWMRGRVQGVGFRWWVRSVALELGLLGIAENLADGRVKVVAEGHRDSCAELLSRLEGPGTPGHVVQVTHRWDQARGGFAGFAERLGARMYVTEDAALTWADANLTGCGCGGTMVMLPARDRRVFAAFLRARPLWSLSVEDLKQWRRLCLAMLAGQTPAWSLRCAGCSDEYVTWKPN